MTRPYLGNPKYTIEVLQKYNFAFQKRFGQNFLIDTHVLEKIIEASKITKDDFVLEIGPGIGTMTQYLAEAAREVVAVEIDKTLIPILENDTLKDWDNVTVINEDILKVDIAALAQEKNGGKPIKVVANFPYYITPPIIMGLFENHHYGTEGSGRQNAGWSWNKGLRCFVSGCSVLCQTADHCECSAELFYAKTEGGKCCYPACEI